MNKVTHDNEHLFLGDEWVSYIIWFQSCYKRYVTMSEAVGERVLDLHNRILSLYILQDSGGRPIDEPRAAHESTPSVHGWWLYMNGNYLLSSHKITQIT